VRVRRARLLRIATAAALGCILVAALPGSGLGRRDGSRTPCTITGTARDDTLVGTARSDILCGLGGNDRISGGDGDDTLRGGLGRDRLAGGAGSDRLFGDDGADVLLSADDTRDVLDGGSGRDRATVDRGVDRVTRVEVGLRGRRPSAGVVVAAAGDIACDPRSDAFKDGLGTADLCRQKYTAELIRRVGPSAVLGLGDFQYEDGTLAKYEQSYARSWGAFRSITWPTPGNHDQYGGGDYYRYFGTRAGPAPYASYSFELGSWHVISINANCEQVGGCESGSRWERWLRRDLETHRARCTLAFWHFPRWSSGPRHGSDSRTDAFVRDLYAAGAELILSAHDHDYERFAPQNPDGRRDDGRGIVQFVVGTGGKFLDERPRRVENSAVFNGDAFGVLELTLRPDGYSWEFVPEPGNRFRDSGSTPCH
jgi:hypothetical protein